jgi:hypothetical protein
MRASRSKPFLHFPVSSKCNLTVSVCLPCRRIVAAAPLTMLTKIEHEHMGMLTHIPAMSGLSKPKRKT